MKIDSVNNLRNGFQGFCCNDRDFCNGIKANPNNLAKILAISGSVVVLLLLTLTCLLILMRRKKAKHRRRRNVDKDKMKENQTSYSNLNPYITSGSGTGLPLLMPRTLTKEIKLECQIGKGKFVES